MFSKNLKYYRLKNELTKKDLAERISVTPMTISNYENGSRKPSMDILKALADALNVRVSDFLAVRNQNLQFKHGEFRKTAALPSARQEYIRETVEEYFNRFMTVIEILGGEVLPVAPECHVLVLAADDEENAKRLRKHLGFALDGPIEELVRKLENKGILVCECDIPNGKFSGMNGFVNNRPYVAINPNMTPERNRSTIVHELAHLMFVWPEEMSEKEIEAKATAISGAFLFPSADAIRELGIKRKSVTKDMVMVAIEYGISMLLLVKRAEINKIIAPSVAKDFYIKASQHGWRTNEPSRIEPEKTALFEQLVCRAINEEDISLQRGTELLKLPYDELVELCCFNEV